MTILYVTAGGGPPLVSGVQVQSITLQSIMALSERPVMLRDWIPPVAGVAIGIPEGCQRREIMHIFGKEVLHALVKPS